MLDLNSLARFIGLLKLGFRAQAAQSQVVYAALGTEAAAQLSLSLRERDPQAVVVSGQRLFSEQFTAATGRAAQNTLIIAPAGAQGAEGTAQYAQATESLRRMGSTPDAFALAGYATIEVWSKAVRRANGGALEGVVRALRSDRFNTAIGSVAFDEHGDRRDLQFAVFQWSDGRFRERSRL